MEPDPLEEKLLHQHLRRRWGRVFMYLGIMVAGGIYLFNPSQYVTEKAPAIVVVAWALSLLFGGMVSFLGTITDRWLGEYTAIPLTASGVALYGLSFVLAFRSANNSLVLPLGILLLGFALGLYARWQDIRDINILKSNRKTYVRRVLDFFNRRVG